MYTTVKIPMPKYFIEARLKIILVLSIFETVTYKRKITII